jgi:predicted DNA-binding transcriptional regulator
MSLGTFDLWMQWWLGYVRNNVPPLKILQHLSRRLWHFFEFIT